MTRQQKFLKRFNAKHKKPSEASRAFKISPRTERSIYDFVCVIMDSADKRYRINNRRSPHVMRNAS